MGKAQLLLLLLELLGVVQLVAAAPLLPPIAVDGGGGGSMGRLLRRQVGKTEVHPPHNGAASIVINSASRGEGGAGMQPWR